MEERDLGIFRVALLIKNVEEGTTAEEDMKTLEMLIGHTSIPWDMVLKASDFSRTHLERCIESDKVTNV